MSQIVLDVGNCEPDHASIKRMLLANFPVQVLQADNTAEALAVLDEHAVSLILINRKLDQDYSDGIEVLKQIKAEARFSAIPIMLVTNYAEHQQLAISFGAVEGFGKLSLNSPETRNRIAAALGT